MNDPTYYQRNLPHRLPPGETLFITFRLAGSLPQIVLEQIRADLSRVLANSSAEAEQASYAHQKRYFGRFDQLLDQARYGPTWLRQPAIAALVQEALHYFDHQAYLLVCYCLMPNHVHLVVTLPDDAPPLVRTLKQLKSYSAMQANRLLGRTGQFWQRESYDHVVRDAAEMQRIIAYVLDNPVKAGLAADWQQWPYSYWRDGNVSSANLSFAYR